MIKIGLKISYVVFITLLILLQPQFIYSQADELELKLVFIDRFTHFIDWNTDPTKDIINDNFTIGTTGENQYTEILREFFKERGIKGKPVEVIAASNKEEYTKCDLLFISDLKTNKVKELLSQIKDLPVLTISDNKQYRNSGLHILLYREADYLQFCIDESALEVSGLKASYLLLESANIINPVIRERP